MWPKPVESYFDRNADFRVMSYKNTPLFLYSELPDILIVQNVKTESEVQNAGSNPVGITMSNNLMKIHQVVFVLIRRWVKITDCLKTVGSRNPSRELGSLRSVACGVVRYWSRRQTNVKHIPEHKDNGRNNGTCEPNVPDRDGDPHWLIRPNRRLTCLVMFHICQRDAKSHWRALKPSE